MMIAKYLTLFVKRQEGCIKIIGKIRAVIPKALGAKMSEGAGEQTYGVDCK